MIDRIQAGLVGCVCCVVLSTAGCLRVAPRMPKVLASAAAVTYTPAAFDTDLAAYRATVASNKLDVAKTERNQIVFHLIAQIDLAYGAFELHLSTSRAGAQTGADATQLGLTAAATLVGATNVKDILTATATAFQGTRLSFDKNFFEEKTTESLISQMRASRKTLQAQMLLSLANRDVTSYPLEAAWIDVANYYYAGTIPSALVDIASKAGGDAVTADKNLQAVVKKLTPGQLAVSIRSAYEKLNKQISSGDAASIASATDSLHKILTSAGVAYDASASAADLLAAMQKAMIAAIDDSDLLNKLSAAVQPPSQ